jgi:hypothetical protein
MQVDLGAFAECRDSRLDGGAPLRLFLQREALLLGPPPFGYPWDKNTTSGLLGRSY